MTTETDGSATAQPDAGTPDVATSTDAAAGSVASVATADPFSGLDSDTLEWIGKAGIKDVGSLAAKARNAESFIGKAVVVPGDDAKPEDWDKFYGRLGRPESADKYEFKLPEGLPENLPYDAEFATEYKSWAHEQGLTPKQAQALHDKFVAKTAGVVSGQMAEAEAKKAERLTRSTETLEHLWKAGAGTPEFQQQQLLAERAYNNLGGNDLKAELAELGLVGPEGEVLAPRLVDALSKIGAALYKEDSLEGGTQASAENPFHSGNLTEQMRAIRSDPDRARRLIAASGKRPSDFGLSD